MVSSLHDSASHVKDFLRARYGMRGVVLSLQLCPRMRQLQDSQSAHLRVHCGANCDGLIHISSTRDTKWHVLLASSCELPPQAQIEGRFVKEHNSLCFGHEIPILARCCQLRVEHSPFVPTPFRVVSEPDITCGSNNLRCGKSHNMKLLKGKGTKTCCDGHV